MSILRYLGRHSRAAVTTLLGALFAIGTVAAAGAGGPPGDRIVALAFDAGSQSLIKAYRGGLYRSGGAEGGDWEQIALPKLIERGRIVAVSIAAHSQGILYIAGSGFGALRSTDGGRSWKSINAGLPSNDIAALSSHAEQPETLYAFVTGHGIFRSEDAGGHWRLMDAGPRAKVLQLIHSNMPGSMQTGWFFAATAKGVGRSMDCFCGWRDAGRLGRAVSAVAYDPRQPTHVYAAAEARLFVSVDGGEKWSEGRSPRGNITALVATPEGTLYAAAGKGELFRSADHGRSWRQVDE